MIGHTMIEINTNFILAEEKYRKIDLWTHDVMAKTGVI